VPRSRELGTSAGLLAAGAGFAVLGEKMFNDLGAIMHASLAGAGRVGVGDGVALDRALLDGFGAALWTLTPFFILTVVVAILAPLALGGWSFSASPLAFKTERLDPIKGLGRIFSAKGLMELLKSLAKFLLITSVAVLLLWQGRDQIIGLAGQSLDVGLAHAADQVTSAFILLAAATLLIAAVDIPFQLWSSARDLRMTRQEIKDELKHTEGRPEVKGRIRELQREVANRRMMEEVPKADVIVTNPAHFAVALRYAAPEMRAPRVVAKGEGHVAARIKELGREHGVAVLDSPALARAVYFSTRLGQEIPVGLYQAVAQVLAWAYRLREASAGAAPPPAPDALDVPPELRVDAEQARRGASRRGVAGQ